MENNKFLSSSYHLLRQKTNAANAEFHHLAHELMCEAGLDTIEDTAPMMTQYGALVAELPIDVAYHRSLDTTPELSAHDEKCNRAFLRIIKVLSIQNLGVHALPEERWQQLKASILRRYPQKTLRKNRALRYLDFRCLIGTLRESWMDVIESCGLTSDFNDLSAVTEAQDDSMTTNLEERANKFQSQSKKRRLSLDDLYRRLIFYVSAWANTPSTGSPRDTFYAQMRQLLLSCNQMMYDEQ